MTNLRFQKNKKKTIDPIKKSAREYSWIMAPPLAYMTDDLPVHELCR
jgi:hypothetical protein